MAKLSSTQIYGDLQVDGEIKNKATTTTEGVVQLSSSTNSTSTTLAATASAVKEAYDLAASKAASSHTHNYAGSSSAGGAATSSLTCTGNAATATKWATARTLTLKGGVTGSASIDGSGNVSIATTLAAHNQASSTITAMTGYAKASAVSAITTTDTLNTAIGKLEKALDSKQASGSYATSSHTHNYAGSSSAGGAATTALACTGNSATATKLATARTINGVSFDGSSNITITASANGGNADTVDGRHASEFPLVGGEISFGNNEAEISTQYFLELLRAKGAFNQYHWVARGTWSYASNQKIVDTGCGTIHLAGCTVEKIGSSTNYTIKISTPPTSINGANNTDFIYVNNGDTYSPTWRKLWNDKNDGSGSGLDADLLDGKHASDFAATSHSHATLTGGQNAVINVGTGNDTAGLSTTNNVDIKSWYGVSFSNSCHNAGITGRPTASIDVRTGTMYLENDIIVGGVGLKSSVVNGKQSVANAINSKLGTSLSNQTSFGDMAYYINSIPMFKQENLVSTSSNYVYMQNCRAIAFARQGGSECVLEFANGVTSIGATVYRCAWGDGSFSTYRTTVNLTRSLTVSNITVGVIVFDSPVSFNVRTRASEGVMKIF